MRERTVAAQRRQAPARCFSGGPIRCSIWSASCSLPLIPPSCSASPAGSFQWPIKPGSAVLTVEKISDTKFLDCREKNPNLSRQRYRGGRRELRARAVAFTREDNMKAFIEADAGAAIVLIHADSGHRQGSRRRRFLVELPGRALEDRRSRHQEGTRSSRRQVYFR